jgi:hypothetical protein
VWKVEGSRVSQGGGGGGDVFGDAFVDESMLEAFLIEECPFVSRIQDQSYPMALFARIFGHSVDIREVCTPSNRVPKDRATW